MSVKEGSLLFHASADDRGLFDEKSMTEKLIEYVQELARQHNEVGYMRTTRGAKLRVQAVRHVRAERHQRRQ